MGRVATSLDEGFQAVQVLVKDFHAGTAHFLSPEYQEAAVRKDYIDKFFVALGWDVDHDIQRNPFEQEVKLENRVTVGGAQRRADYAFFIAPNFRDPRFLVEAKKPAGGLATADNYFQTTRYGWHKQNLLAGLTDFLELHLLDCRYKPNIDTALQRCVRKYHYTDYADAEKFAEIYWLLSREAVASNSLDKLATSLPQPKKTAKQHRLFTGGYQGLDESFLQELDEHRLALARAFKSQNHDLDSGTLTELTQRTLDRLVFMRFLEDKLIEPEHFVPRFGQHGPAWYDFVAESRRLDTIYDGIVFKRHDILDAPGFPVDNHAFLLICEALCHLNSLYDFNEIPIHILGSIYERFLANVIVATGKRVRIEPKPEVRKAGGVFYTPDYVVRYIVEETVGKLIEGKTPAQIARMRFADIACGSGSFLLAVFDLLLRHHTRYYNGNPTKARKGDCILRDGVLHLSLEKRRDILLNNIYGVDIDPQAVEVTQLSLDLKLLEEETLASARSYQRLMHAALLPPLNQNIVCGNSLIEQDILHGKLFAADEERRLNPMSFRGRFPEAVAAGGFDAIVGNPPYIRMEALTEIKDYLKSHYASHAERADLYAYFIERAHTLLKPGGRFGMIVSNKFLRANYGKQLREFLTANAAVERIVDLAGLPVFPGATVRTILLLTSRAAHGDRGVFYCPPLALDSFAAVASNAVPLAQAIRGIGHEVPAGALTQPIWGFAASGAERLLARLKEMSTTLATYCNGQICRGIVSGLTAAFLIDGAKRQAILDANPEAAEIIKPVLNGRQIRRYYMRPGDQYLIYTFHGVQIRKYPAIEEHLRPFRSQLVKRATKQAWYELQQPQLRFVPLMEGAKIIFPDIAMSPRFCFDAAGYYGTNTTYFIPGADLYLLSILNSKLGYFYFRETCAGLEGKTDIYLRFFGQYLEGFPVHQPDPTNCADRTRRDRLALLAEQMTQAQNLRARARTDRDKDYYENRLLALDREIDETVYELYALTENEIALVEQSTSSNDDEDEAKEAGELPLAPRLESS
jgi:hypothetical protein